MSAVSRRSVAVLVVAMMLAAAATASAEAKERPWYKYENSSFEAISNGPGRATQNLLQELVNFRAAVLQVANIDVPDGAPKTRVFILASDKEFRELIGNSDIGGFAGYVDGVPHIAMPVGAHTSDNEMALRHEYTHVLLSYKNVRYPPWFREGFAELFSSLKFRKKNTEFTVGEFTGRWRSGKMLKPWDDILSNDFSMHSLGGGAWASDAYLQAWLLTHYFILGDNFENVLPLAQYINLYNQGRDSIEAFEAVTGTSPDELGDG